MAYLLLVVAAIVSAFQVMHAQRLMVATLWLALTSALVSILLFLLEAPEVAVIELSVGAGLVTVLFVFAFSIVGEHTFDPKTLVPRPLTWGLILALSFLLGWFLLPVAGASAVPDQQTFSEVLWQQRGLDVLAQVVLIFAGVLGLMGLLSEARVPAAEPARQAVKNLSESGLPQTAIPGKHDGQMAEKEPAAAITLEEAKA
jgi:NADH:ubiquinone oxidoreductase subunit 6 (subunit J)